MGSDSLHRECGLPHLLQVVDCALGRDLEVEGASFGVVVDGCFAVIVGGDVGDGLNLRQEFLGNLLQLFNIHLQLEHISFELYNVCFGSFHSCLAVGNECLNGGDVRFVDALVYGSNLLCEFVAHLALALGNSGSDGSGICLGEFLFLLSKFTTQFLNLLCVLGDCLFNFLNLLSDSGNVGGNARRKGIHKCLQVGFLRCKFAIHLALQGGDFCLGTHDG